MQYKPAVAPAVVGKTCFTDRWKGIEEKKKLHESELEERKMFKQRRKNSLFPNLHNMLDLMKDDKWNDFLGRD